MAISGTMICFSPSASGFTSPADIGTKPHVFTSERL